MSEESQPRPPGAMPQEQIEDIARKLNERIERSGACKVCGKGHYSIGPHLVAPPVIQDGGLMLGGPTYPLVMLICGNCGHTRFHNITALGLQGGENG